jgi:hypothetical protein
LWKFELKWLCSLKDHPSTSEGAPITSSPTVLVAGLVVTAESNAMELLADTRLVLSFVSIQA